MNKTEIKILAKISYTSFNFSNMITERLPNGDSFGIKHLAYFRVCSKRIEESLASSVDVVEVKKS